MARSNKPLDLDDDDQPRRRKKTSSDTGMPTWGWVLIAIGGVSLIAVGSVCAGLLWVGGKATEAVQDVATQNAPSQQSGLEVDRYVLQEPDESVVLTSKIRLGNYYNFAYSDSAETHYSFRLSGDRQTLSVWVPKASREGRMLYESCKDAKEHTATVRVQRIGPDGLPTKHGQQGTSVIEVIRIN